MESTNEQSAASTGASGAQHVWPAGVDSEGLPLPDPRIVEKLVEELKSQGMFDQIRKDCLAEVDTKPAYQNLRSRVSETVHRFLGRQRWSPNLNKNQLRNQLKQHIQQTPFMEDGVERIVEQVVNPKIMSVIEPEVENLICGFFGVDRGNATEDVQNGNPAASSTVNKGTINSAMETIDPAPKYGNVNEIFEGRPGVHMAEKMSNVSSEDIDMRSAGDSEDNMNTAPKDMQSKLVTNPASDTSSPGPGLRGDISPLTPERQSQQSEQYSESAFVSPFSTVGPFPPRGPAGFIPPPPADCAFSMQIMGTSQLQGNISPLTPPPITVRPASPRTPPLPPDFGAKFGASATTELPPPPLPIELPPLPDHDGVETQEEIVLASNQDCEYNKSGNEMSPVSDTEFTEIGPSKRTTDNLNLQKERKETVAAAISPHLANVPGQEPPLPPKYETREVITPPPPPPPENKSPPKPPSPLTSPIGSSPDDMEEPSRNSAAACYSKSVMAPDLRTPRQMMQSQYNRALVPSNAGNFTPGDTQSSVSASDISDTDLPEASEGTVSDDNADNTSSKNLKSKIGAEDDLEALEKEKLDLQAKLAATKIGEEDEAIGTPLDDSDGEVHTDDSNDYLKRFREIASGAESHSKTHETTDNIDTSKKISDESREDSNMSPISSEGPTPEPRKIKDEPEVKDDHNVEKITFRKKDEHDDDNDQSDFSKKLSTQGVYTSSGGLSLGEGGGQSASKPSDGSPKDKSSQECHQSSSTAKHSSHYQSKRSSGKSDRSEERKKSHSTSSHHSSSSDTRKSSHHKHSRRDSEKTRQSSSHSDRHKHKRDKEQKQSNTSKNDSHNSIVGGDHGKSFDKKLDKEAKKEMEKKREQKLKSFEEKVNQTYKLKSDKYEAIDMFAPKPSKISSSITSKTSNSPNSASTPSAIGLKTPPSFGSKTPPTFGLGTSDSLLESSSNSTSKSLAFKKKDHLNSKSPSISSTPTKSNTTGKASSKDVVNNNERKKVEKIKEQLLKEREKIVHTSSTMAYSVTEAEIVEKPRKLFPELPVTKCDGDKIEQHKDDFATTKRRLEEARARKMADVQKKKEIDKIRRKSQSGSISNSSSGDKLNLTLNFQSKTGDTRVHDMALVEMELQMMEDHRRKDKKKHKDRKRKESEKLEHRSKNKERKNSMDDSDEPTASPKNPTSKQKSSREDDEFSSDSEWKEFRLKVPEDVTPKKREQRKRKPNRKYSSSDDQSEELMDIDDSVSHSKSKLLKSSFNNVFVENQGSICKTSSTTDMSSISTMSRSAIKKQAEDLLESDVNIKPFHGYKENEISHDEKKSNWYKECLSSEAESMNFSEVKEVDCFVSRDFYAEHDFIYLTNLHAMTQLPNAWKGAKKVASILEKMFGGNPKVVRPIPRWLMLKLDHWGLRRHEVELIDKQSRTKDHRIYTETEMDKIYPENESIQNRFKQIMKTIDDPFQASLYKPEDSNPLLAISENISEAQAKISSRRDTVEKNLDEMFSSDQETDFEMKEPLRKKHKRNERELCNDSFENAKTPLHLLEPFHGFMENETTQTKCETTSKPPVPICNSDLFVLPEIPSVSSNSLQVDSKGNTFGMSSVFASPISDFSSDYDDDDIADGQSKPPSSMEADKKLPMSVQMNYPMIQYLKEALQNNVSVMKSLEKLLGSSSSNEIIRSNNGNILADEISRDNMTLSKTRVVLNTKLKEHLDIDGISLCSEDEDGSVSSSANVSSVGLHVLPPSPVSFSGSLSSTEDGIRN